MNFQDDFLLQGLDWLGSCSKYQDQLSDGFKGVPAFTLRCYLYLPSKNVQFPKFNC